MTAALPGWTQPSGERTHVIGVLLGEGVGPEVMRAALAVLEAVAETTGERFDLRVGGDVGRAALERSGCELSPEVAEFCASIFADGGAVLCGPGGGRFVYDLRARFDLYCKLTPIVPFAALDDAGILRAHATRDVDVVVVRENRGGIYFGTHDRDPRRRTARHAFEYRPSEVARIVEVAASLARARRGRLTVVVKSGGIPAVSALWREEAERVCAAHEVVLDVLDVDNAAYQLVAAAAAFDVIVAPNLFGDVLSDLGAVLLRSRGMSYSGNFGVDGVAVYQTGHGAAYDLAGTDQANPLGQIQSMAMMLRESLGLAGAADRIVAAIEHVLTTKIRTTDLAAAGATVVGTREMGARVADAVRRARARTRLSA
jgi:3-isopropylmalate dehydrogenase